MLLSTADSRTFPPEAGFIRPARVDFSSFEYISFKTEIKQSSILYITIYKPPQNCFIDDFTELLLIVCTVFDCLVITGDLNVHVDVAQDK